MELKPRAESHKKSLSSYRKVVEIQSEFSFIGSWETSLKAELFETEHAEEESENEFSAKGRFDRSIVDPFDSLLEQIMRACKYEGVGSQASDSMKSALFQYMIDHQDNRQVIVIENDIPKLDYQDKAHIVRFTKDESQGRYGFLEGVR